jgi:dynamin 1-like protein
MDQLIPIASKLQDVLGALGQTTTLDLPQIVVVGGQSSGKSSVLEGIVGRSFLPRGHGIVTRRPLVLQLYNTSSSSSSDDDDEENVNPQNEPDEWGEFLHLPNRVFSNFQDICHEIQRETDRLTGSNKGIHATPIHLKIYSPHVLSLTLVDLPGMAKVAVGDQPNDIEDLIREMCLSYISNPNAIILAVTAANTDLANSDALKLAQAVDPHGHRTVGVLTKVDLMDPGTDCVDVLQNKVVPLVRGYVAVVNRGQQDINDNVSIRDGLKKEASFFQNHVAYKRDASVLQKCGTRHLSKSLNNMLMHHIRNVLPELKTKICNMMADVQSDLEALGSPITLHSSKSSQGGALLSMLSKFSSNFASIIEGRGGGGASQQQQHYYYYQNASPNHNHTTTTAHAATNELFGGARISYIFTEIFSSSLMTVGPFDGLTDNEIRTTICNANGTRPALFVPEISFDILVKRQMARLEQPGIQCVDLVYEELQRIASQSEPSELTRFPNLRERMVEVVSSLLKRCVGPTQMMVANLVKIELAYINTSHPDFIGGSRAVAKLMEKIGNDNEARKLQRDRESETTTNTTTNTTPGTIHAHPPSRTAVGATPLSSSSLSNYYNPHVQHNGDNDDDDDSVETGALPPNSYHDLSGGGIMNFIFRGGKHPKANTTTNMSEYHNQNRHYANGIGRGEGPPSIVHLPQVPDSMRQTDVPPTERERVEMEIIKSLIESYFAIVRKNFIDMVPKTIMYFLVNHVRDAIQNELVSELYRDAEIATLMQEAEDIAQRRQTCVEMRDLLSKALEIVNEVRDFNTFK